VLLNTQRIAANSPASTVTGFRIKSGTLTFPANITVVSGVIHIAPTEKIQLDAVLDPPAAPPVVTGPGADATAAVTTLPASVTIVFGPSGGQITESAFATKVYGASLALRHSPSTPHFDSVLQQILVPASVNPTTFSIGFPSVELESAASPVPEPSSLAFMCISLCAVAFSRRCKRPEALHAIDGNYRQLEARR
jgi:hypothetical protein